VTSCYWVCLLPWLEKYHCCSELTSLLKKVEPPIRIQRWRHRQGNDFRHRTTTWTKMQLLQQPKRSKTSIPLFSPCHRYRPNVVSAWPRGVSDAAELCSITSHLVDALQLQVHTAYSLRVADDTPAMVYVLHSVRQILISIFSIQIISPILLLIDRLID